MMGANPSLKRETINRVGLAVLCAALIILILTVVRARDLISGDISRRENPAAGYSMLMDSFPDDFKNLLSYLRTNKSELDRILWYPLNFANYIFIPDATTSKGVFVGTSFVREVTKHRDYPGFYNLGPRQDSIKLSMLKGDYQPLCYAIWENNINLVVVNKYLLDDSFNKKFQSFFSYERPFDIYNAQRNKKFDSSLFGQQLALFGGFGLYQIHSNLRSEKVELYEGKSWSNSLNDLDWCTRVGVGKLDSQYTYDATTKIYSISAKVKEAKQLSIILSEYIGDRYRLKIEGPAIDYVAKIDYETQGAKLIARVTFKKPLSGDFQARFESRSKLERYLKPIIALQALFLAMALGYVLFQRKSLKF